MEKIPELMVMLTYRDRTVSNAYEIFEQCKNTSAILWGFKEEGLPFPQMQALFAYMKSCGKTTGLEVVAYSEPECLRGAQMAAECGCSVLMGTCFFDSVNDFCHEHHLKYMPFVGKISNRPSILEGSLSDMLSQAAQYLKKGVYGLDLLGYRYTADATALIRQFVAGVDAPVCVAGSVNSYQRLDEIKAAAPASFTIGSAFFEHAFGNSFAEQIENVYRYMHA